MGQEQDVPRTRQAEAELRTTASPDEAYAAWADPAGIAAWFVDAARGEAVAGGTMIWEWKDFGIEVPYRVLEADPGRRLVLATPGNVAPAGMIEITITRDGGATVLRVVNSGFLDEAVWDDVFEDTRLGWIGALALLQQYLERGAGRRMRRFLHMRPTHAAYEAVVPWFEEEHRLQQWLATSGQPRAAGESFDIVFRDAGARTARVIVRTPRTLTLAFDGEPEALELMVFTNAQFDEHPGAPRTIAVRGTCWHDDVTRFDRLRTATGAALDRLVALLTALPRDPPSA